VFEDPVTEAVNVADWSAVSDAEDGPTFTPTGSSDTVAVAVIRESAALFAVIVMVCWLAMIDGAWYTPLLIVPTGEFKDHVTAVFEVPVTVGLKVALWPPVSDADDGPTVNPITCNDTVALAVLVESATLVAMIVTVSELLIVVGAV
jgi:hypothetical protein